MSEIAPEVVAMSRDSRVPEHLDTRCIVDNISSWESHGTVIFVKLKPFGRYNNRSVTDWIPFDQAQLKGPGKPRWSRRSVPANIGILASARNQGQIPKHEKGTNEVKNLKTVLARSEFRVPPSRVRNDPSISSEGSL